MAGGGIALFDCDNDGKLDIAVVNDSTTRSFPGGRRRDAHSVSPGRSRGRIHFTDITTAAGLTARGWGMAIAVGDYDNDGLPDLYVTGYGHNVLYHNEGGCRFKDVTEHAGVKVGGFSTGAAWADYDRDGYIDVFVARYVDEDVNHLPALAPGSETAGVGMPEAPDAMTGESDILLRNRGDGTFEDVSVRAGVSNPAKLHGMGVIWGDYDNDGWPDLFVANDSGANYLYRNVGNGTFEENGVSSGTALGANGETYGNMGGDFGDYNRDGRLDLVTTRYRRQPVSLYENDKVVFTDVAAASDLARDTAAPVKWGVGFGDFDDDGWPEILIANGNFSSSTDGVQSEPKFREPLQLFRNIRGQSFVDVATQAGLNAGPLQSRRGVALGDINNDGKLDFVVFNVDGPPSLFLNESRNANHHVLFRLVGSRSNRMAIGARVSVSAGGITQIDEIRGGGGYNSSSDTRLHFGLGQSAVMSSVEVRWPDGGRQEFQNLGADASTRFMRNKGFAKSRTWRSRPAGETVLEHTCSLSLGGGSSLCWC